MIVTLDEPKALCPNILLPINQVLPVLLGGDWICHSVFLPYSFHEYSKVWSRNPMQQPCANLQPILWISSKGDTAPRAPLAMSGDIFG